jgi:radical SAM superfamily enzyme YgiQ (UPF0313 family)
MDLKILLINLLSYSEEPAYIEHENLGLGYVASSLRDAGYSVRLIGVEVTKAEGLILNEIEQFGPRLVGFSLCFDTIQSGLSLCRRIKAAHPDVCLCLGGHHATFMADEILRSYPAVDVVVRGEGEQTAIELVKALACGESLHGIAGLSFRDKAGIVENASRPKISPLDELPFPARDILEDRVRGTDLPYSWAMVLSSRGCHGHCNFCSVASFYRLQKGPVCRYRSAANVVDEIEELKSKHNILSFLFEDDNFVNPTPESKKHVLAIAEELMRRKLNILFGCGWRADSLNSLDAQDRELLELLKKAGLFSVFIGLESGHDEELALYNKIVTLDNVRQMVALLRDQGISTTIGFIMFNSYSTAQSVSRNAEFLKETLLGTEFRVFSHRVQLQPGVPLIRKLARDGLLLKPQDISDVYYYEFKDAVVRRVADAAKDLYKHVAPTDGMIRSTILDSFFMIRKFNDLGLKVHDALLDQNVDALISKHQSLIMDLNKTNYETFMSLIRAARERADRGEDAGPTQREFQLIEESHLAAANDRLEALKNFCRFLCSYMDDCLGRLLGSETHES